MNKLQVGDKVKILGGGDPYDPNTYAGEVFEVILVPEDYPEWVVVDIDGRPHAWEIEELEKV